MHWLSKSKYIRGLQCDRALWLDVHAPSLARYTREQMRRFDAGRSFERTFKDRFPGAIDVSARLGRSVDQYPEFTGRALDQPGPTVLFESGFLFDGVLVLADVVCRRPDGRLDVFEVKSGSVLSDTYRRDAALQHYVIAHCRPVASFSVVHGDGAGGFVEVDLTADLAAEADTVARNIALMREVAFATAEPDTPTGAHCLAPYACPYQGHCRQGVRQLSLF